MKLEKFTADKAVSVIGQTAAGVTGMMLSNGASEMLPIQNKTFAKAGLLIAGLAGAVFIGGKDTIAKSAQAASLGVALQQGKELLKEVVSPMLPEGTSSVNKFINASFEQPALAGRAMGNPEPYRFRLANPLQDEPEQRAISFAMA